MCEVVVEEREEDKGDDGQARDDWVGARETA